MIQHARISENTIYIYTIAVHREDYKCFLNKEVNIENLFSTPKRRQNIWTNFFFSIPTSLGESVLVFLKERSHTEAGVDDNSCPVMNPPVVYSAGPLKLSTLYLLNTYQHIQKLRESRTERDVANRVAQAVYYTPQIGELLNHGKYKVVDMLGKGSFGIVVKAEVLDPSGLPLDFDHNMVAVKILRKGASFLQQGRREFKMLTYIQEKQRSQIHNKDLNLFLNAMENFFHEGHFCIVSELLSDSLFDLVKCSWAVKPERPGLSLRMVKKMAHQLLCALLALKNLKIVHCDVKPENIALINPNKPRLKLLDFGSCCFVSDICENQFPYIQSRYYRAPEVLLGSGYDCAIDMWSLGCVILELYLGKPLFVGKNTVEQLYKIIEVVGMPPDELLDNSVYYYRFFTKETEKNVPIADVCILHISSTLILTF